MHNALLITVKMMFQSFLQYNTAHVNFFSNELRITMQSSVKLFLSKLSEIKQFRMARHSTGLQLQLTLQFISDHFPASGVD